MGLQDAATDPEITGVITDPLEGELDPDSGHGTFIAGLIRQALPGRASCSASGCSAATARSPSRDLLRRAAAAGAAAPARAQRRTTRPTSSSTSSRCRSATTTSSPRTRRSTPCCTAPLRAARPVRRRAWSPRPATTRRTARCYPGRVRPYPGGGVPRTTSGSVPVVSVGALNPDGTSRCSATTAPWVPASASGAALVSTLPDHVRRLAQPAALGRCTPATGWRAHASTRTTSPAGFGRLERHVVRRTGPRRRAGPGRARRRRRAARVDHAAEVVAARPGPRVDAADGRVRAMIGTEPSGETLARRGAARAVRRLPRRRPRRSSTSSSACSPRCCGTPCAAQGIDRGRGRGRRADHLAAAAAQRRLDPRPAGRR